MRNILSDPEPRPEICGIAVTASTEAMVGLSLLPFFGGVVSFMGLIIWAVAVLHRESNCRIAAKDVGMASVWHLLFVSFSALQLYILQHPDSAPSLSLACVHQPRSSNIR